MSNFHIVLMYCIPSPLAALKSRIETFWVPAYSYCRGKRRLNECRVKTNQTSTRSDLLRSAGHSRRHHGVTSRWRWRLDLGRRLGLLHGLLDGHQHLHSGQQCLLMQQNFQHAEFHRDVLQSLPIRRRKLRMILVCLKPAEFWHCKTSFCYLRVPPGRVSEWVVA